MKKILLLLLLFVIPISVSAKEYSAVDLTIDFDDSKWYVFTRDNIKDNEELKELGITYEYMNSFFLSNYAYLDAAIVYENPSDTLESFVMIKDSNLERNLHTYTENDIKDLENELIKNYNVFEHGIYSFNDYKYVYMVYEDNGLNIIDYYTSINGKMYTIKLQKQNKFTSEEKELMKSIVNTISFKLDPKYEKHVKTNKSEGINYKEIIITTIIGGIVGGIIGGVIGLINRSKKAKKEDK